MYELEFLPAARRDLSEIVRYISRELQNPTAAETLAGELIAAAEAAREFPYAAPLYVPIRPLRHEYRKLIVRNYAMFYRVNERERKITVAGAIYAKRNCTALLE